ncbi:DUF948 domain-containing protein [Haematomicrobium sanguinis]|uniref:DUF948 domain-containing protein n=1 Tax=Haematomicrobium sanguinis TaxID=479106 RepID=UPI00047AF292|nr:DUF948 domain-containing protein [Haematomicrobium sanguinis]
MTPGDIAALIWAGGFILFVLLAAIPIVKLGRFIDEMRRGMGDLANGATPLVEEVTQTVTLTNDQIKKVDVVSNNVSDASANLSALSSLMASTLGQPLIKVSAFTYGVRRAIAERGRSASGKHSR